MKLQNGYKVIYEEAKNGMRTFYASKSNAYPDKENDLPLASFKDEDYRKRVIYEFDGKFYASAVGTMPKYENGVPADECINSDNFNLVFGTAESDNQDGTAAVNEVADEPVEVEEDVTGGDTDNTPEDDETQEATEPGDEVPADDE